MLDAFLKAFQSIRFLISELRGSWCVAFQDIRTRSSDSGRCPGGPSITQTATSDSIRIHRAASCESNRRRPEIVSAVSVSLWENKKNADDYNAHTYPEVLKTLAKVVDGTPQVHTYETVILGFPSRPCCRVNDCNSQPPSAVLDCIGSYKHSPAEATPCSKPPASRGN